jgi:E3 ubiquitin-protein ligase UBR4
MGEGAAAAAGALALSLARHALALVTTTQLSARHVDALAAALQLSPPASSTSSSSTAGGASRRQLSAAVTAVAWAVLGDPTPLGPSLADAAMPPPLREVFIRRVIVQAATPQPRLLALAGGWLVAALSYDVSAHGGATSCDGDDVARRVWSAALEKIRNAGWTSSSATAGAGGSPGGHFAFSGASAFEGWYAEAAAVGAVQVECS